MEAADRETYDKMEKEISDYTREIERMQREEAMDRELSKPVATPIVEKPKVLEDEEPVSFRARKEYKDAMISALRSNFRNVSNVLQEGVDADGGYRRYIFGSRPCGNSRE